MNEEEKKKVIESRKVLHYIKIINNRQKTTKKYLLI